MGWTNPGPVNQVIIVAKEGDLLVYDGNPVPGQPFGTLVAALSGAAGDDGAGFNFWQGLSLQHNGPGINWSINGLSDEDEGKMYAFVDGLLKNHLQIRGPGLVGNPKAILDFNLDGAVFQNSAGDTGIGFNSQFGGVNIGTKSGTSVSIGNAGATIIFGANGTPFGQFEFGSFDVAFSASNSQSGTLTFPSAFTSEPNVNGNIIIGSNLDVLMNWQTISTGTNIGWRLFQKSGTNITGTAHVRWQAWGAI